MGYELSQKKVIQVATIVENDANGNQVVKEEKKVVSYPSEPEYIKVYIKDLLYLKDMPQRLNPVLQSLLACMSYKNMIVLNSSIKQILSDKLKLSVSSFNHSLTELVKGEVLIRKMTGCYIPNPALFGRGAWKDICDLRLELNYTSLEGRTFKTAFEYRKEQKEKEGNLEKRQCSICGEMVSEGDQVYYDKATNECQCRACVQNASKDTKDAI